MKLIYIEWCDAIEAQKTWQSLEEIKEWADTNNWIVCEVGYLIKETKEYILIANRASLYDEDEPTYAGVMKIPFTWIKKRIDLTNSIK